jgi:hypothetical protein
LVHIMRKPLALLFALFVAMLFPTGPAQAQFDWRKVVPPRINVPSVPDVVGPRGVGPHRNLIPSSSLRRALGALAVGAIGVAILSSLSESQRRDLSRRVDRIVRADRDRQVVEHYEVGKKRVVVVVSPVAPKCTFKDEPSLKPTSASGVSPDEKPKTPAKKSSKDAGKEDDGVVAFHQLPKETPCRTVETKIAELGDTKSDAPSASGNNVALVCELSEGDWRPTQFSQKPQPAAADTPPSDPACQDG